jgi:polyisoprenyl-teichoic acid--peptidoglycan teichoic acid transferase
VHELETGSRADRQRRRRARYRKWRLMGVAVLVGLLSATGAYAGIFREGGGTEAGYSATEVGAQGSSVPLVAKTRGPALETTEGLVASRRSEPPHDDATNKPVPENTPKIAEESLDVLVLGVDRRPEDAESSSAHSDTLMLVRVSPRTGRVQSLSVPRDLLVEIEPGMKDRINTAYLHGGTERATWVMENLTGISIERYAIVDFGGFEDVIDSLGGVTVDVEQPIRLGIEGRRVYIPAGKQELDGLQALAYARYRGSACGDLDRIRRQQRLVAALRKQALGWNTITKLPAIVKVVHENVETNLGALQAISLGRALVGRGADGGMKFYQLKGKPETLPNGDQVLIPDEQTNERILEYFRNDGPTMPRHGPTKLRQDQAPRADGSPSKC